MIGVILDSNIYGRIIEEGKDGLALADKIKNDQSLVVHNFVLIRKELRRAPKVLPIYDRIVAQRQIKETKQIKDLAQAYFQEYKRNGGVQGQRRMMNDFKIVACASILGCDIIYSDDERTLKHPIARKAYEDVNSKRGLRPPYLSSYQTLKGRYF